MRHTIISVAIAAITCMTSFNSDAKIYGDTMYIPERAIILSGDSANADHRENIAILYSRGHVV